MFPSTGYFHCPDFFSGDSLKDLMERFAKVHDNATMLLRKINDSGDDLATFYTKDQNNLIVVPEVNSTAEICRFEHIAGSCVGFGEFLEGPIQEKLAELTGHEFVLFKDKCNIKAPGGGAFRPHQDIPAYIDFGPTYHITAAIFLDDATIENGCLQFAENFLSVETEQAKTISTLVGPRPLYDYEDGGIRNGDIDLEVQKMLEWSTVQAASGDVLFFDSYVPHRSEVNNSTNSRRVIFLTFNARSEGNFYDQYYASKRADYSNPAFHISTPTKHAKH